MTNFTEFWEVFRRIKKSSQFPVRTDYHIFKRGVLPIWADNMNKDWGKLSILLTWKSADIIREEVTLSFLGTVNTIDKKIIGISMHIT